MTDRHQELRRQHELLHEHLAWLEREMARESVAANTPIPVVTSASAHASPVLVQPSSTSLPAEDADTLLNTYSAEERHNPKSTKRGCLLIFAITLGLLIAGVTAAYFLFYARR